MSKSSNMRRAGREAFVPNLGCRSCDPDFVLGWMEAKEIYEDKVAAERVLEESVEAFDLEHHVGDIEDLKRWIREYVVPHLIKGN
jgi:hypothetical protein